MAFKAMSHQFARITVALIAALLLTLLAACNTAPINYQGVLYQPGSATDMLSMPSATRASIDDLATALVGLSSKVQRADATALAKEAHLYPLHLANVWQVGEYPLLHNLKRNSGEREYGLCIDWTFAMRERMRGMGLGSFDWYWGIANQGSDLFEHSTLVVTAKGQPFTSGIVLDPWRNSGRLFWRAIDQDPKYKWSPYTEPEGWSPFKGTL